MGNTKDDGIDVNEWLNSTKPVSAISSNAAAATSSDIGLTQSVADNPFLLNANARMAARDGNQPYQFYNAGAGDDESARNALADSLAIPKPRFHEADDVALRDDPVANSQSNPTPNTGVAINNNSAPTPKNSSQTTSDDGDLMDKADRMSNAESVSIGGQRLSRSEYPGDAYYTSAIYRALMDQTSKRSASDAIPQGNENSGDVYKNPWPVSGLNISLQALVDKSYELAKNPAAFVNGQKTERSHYNDQEGYRRMILRDLLAEVHGGYDKIPDEEDRLINPQYSPALAKNAKVIHFLQQRYEDMLAGGASEIVRLPAAIKSAVDTIKDIQGSD